MENSLNYPTPKFEVGKYAISKEYSGIITGITMSTGAKKGILYRVGHNSVFEDEIYGVIDIRYDSNYFYKQVQEVADEAEKEIKALVMKFGKVKAKKADEKYVDFVNGKWETKKPLGTNVEYTLKNNPSFRGRNGELVFIHTLKTEKDVPYNPHLFLYDADGRVLADYDFSGGRQDIFPLLYMSLIHDLEDKTKLAVKKK